MNLPDELVVCSLEPWDEICESTRIEHDKNGGWRSSQRGIGTRGLRLLTEGAWISSRYRRVLIARPVSRSGVSDPAARTAPNSGKSSATGSRGKRNGGGR